MTKYGSVDFIIKIDATDGGSLTDYSQYIDTIAGFKITRLTQESHTAGDAWVEHLWGGVRRGEPFTIEGFYDTTIDATLNGTHAVTRSVQLTYGGSKTSDFEAWIQDYERVFVRGELTRFRATILPSGAVSEN